MLWLTAGSVSQARTYSTALTASGVTGRAGTEEMVSMARP